MNKLSIRKIGIGNWELVIGNWENFEKNNVTTALNVFYSKKEKIYHAYASKHNSSSEKQVIFFIISNGEKGRCYYLAVKTLSALLG